jgi:site-specific DNA-methyltransferase (adenine-specific)
MTAVHIVVAMKPIEVPFADNALELGVAGLNIDGSRVESGGENTLRVLGPKAFGIVNDDGWVPDSERIGGSESGRFPANVVHDGSDEVIEQFPETGVSAGGRTIKRGGKYKDGKVSAGVVEWSNDDPGYGDDGSAARFFKECKA